MNKKITFSAPGKIIISGEHAVVYGYPALVAAVDRRIYLELKLNKDFWKWRFRSGVSGISGMGSSAAYATLEAAGLSWIVNQKLDLEKISRIAHEIENLAHGTASGVDTTIVTYGGILKYEKQEKFNKINNLNKINKIPKFLIVNTGKPAETTGMLVEMVSEKRKAKSEKLQFKTKNLIKDIGQLPEKFVKALKEGDLNALSDLIKENERLLEKLGVVGEIAKKIVRDIEEIGGVAKICGAGGIKKGSGIALVYHKDLDVIRKYCRRKKLECFEVELGGEGVRREKERL